MGRTLRGEGRQRRDSRAGAQWASRAVSVVSMGTPDTPRDGDPSDDEHLDHLVDEAEQESYPSSDPQSFWAGPDEPLPDKDPEAGSEPSP